MTTQRVSRLPGKMPNGADATTTREYIDAWTAMGKEIKRITGWAMTSYGQGTMTFKQDGVAMILPAEPAMKIVIAIPKRVYIGLRWEVVVENPNGTKERQRMANEKTARNRRAQLRREGVKAKLVTITRYEKTR